MKSTVAEIIDALAFLNLDGDTLFRRIKDDLDAGCHESARDHLEFVDRLLAARQKEINV